MSEILLVNPRRRRRKTVSRKRRAPSRRRRNPVASNPRRRRKVTRRRRNPVAANPRRRRRVSRRRRNPTATATFGRAFKTRNIQGQLKTASTGALGAIALDVGLAYLPLPAMLKSGIPGKIAKGAAAIVLGVFAHQFLKVSAVNASRMTEGALTVQLHGIGREMLTQFAPQVALSAYINDEFDNLGYAGSGWNPTNSLSWNGGNRVEENGVSAYMSPGYDGSMHDSSEY